MRLLVTRPFISPILAKLYVSVNISP